MNSQTFELAILLSLRDYASGGLARTRTQLSAMGRDGRQALASFEDLKRGLAKGVSIAAIGTAGLATIYKGVQVSATLEESLHDLKSAFQAVGESGTVDLARLGDQMNRAEQLGVDLGNKLQGTTQDYLDIFSSLKKAGVDVETVLSGAGRSAAYLANVSGAIRTGTFREQAKELGQFGMMFKLRPAEFEKSVNIFAALKDRFDVESSSLIESAKYFQATAASLGVTGMKGAEDTVKVFALLKRMGAIEGSQAGTGLTSMFSHFITHKKEVDKLKKETGIDLQFFKGGKFVGFEDQFAQMAQFRKLSNEQRSEKLFKLFGEQGSKVANVMVEAGAKGWENIGTERKKAVPVNEKINQQMELFNSKLEAVQGSITNLVATGFMPLLDTAKPILDVLNEIVGEVQSFAKEHPGIAQVASHLFGVGSTGLIVVGGIKAMRSAWGLWKVASTIGASEAGLLSFLRIARVEAYATGAALQQASMQSSLSAIFGGRSVVVGSAASAGTAAGGAMTAAMGGALMAGLGFTIAMAIENANRREAETAAAAAGEQLGELFRQRMAERIEALKGDVKENVNKALQEINQKFAPEEGKQVVQKLGLDKQIGVFSPENSQFVELLKQIKTGRAPGASFGSYDEEAVKQQAMRRAVAKFYVSGITNIENLRESLSQAQEALRSVGRLDLYGELVKVAEQAFPDLMDGLKKQSEASKELATESGNAVQSLGRLTVAIRDLSQIRLGVPTTTIFPSRSFSTSGYGIPIGRPNPLLPGGGLDTSGFGKPFAVPSRAMGGFVERGGVAVIHAGERIVPARVTRGLRERAEPRDRGSRGEVHLHFHIPEGAPVAKDRRALVAYVTHQVERQLERS